MDSLAQYLFPCLSALALVVGVVGCFAPVVPGPVLSYAGILLLLPTAKPPSAGALVAFGVLTALVTVLDYIVPAIGAKKFNCSRAGVVGCTVGTVIGIFFLPIGLLLGPFLGAFVGELIAGKNASAAAKGGLGALIGFVSGVFIKLLACISMAFYCLVRVFC